MGTEKKTPFYVMVQSAVYQAIKADAAARGWTLTTWFDRLVAEKRPDLVGTNVCQNSGD